MYHTVLSTSQAQPYLLLSIRKGSRQAVVSLGRKVMFGVSHFPGSAELGGLNEKLNSFDTIP